MDPRDEVLAAAEARARALASSDSEKLTTILHPDFVWTTHVGQRFGRDAYVERNTGGLTVWHGQELKDAHVTVVDDTAVLVAEVVDVVEGSGGLSETFRMPVTQTWVRVGEHWRCLAGHAGPRMD